MTVEFDGRVVVVTGGGRGLGRCYALMAAAHGARVVVDDDGAAVDGSGSDPAVAESVAAEIRDAGGEAVACHASVATPEGGAQVVSVALDTFGSVDAVVHNAGILRDKTLGKLSDEEVDAVLGVHLLGGFNVVRPAFRHMKDQGYGRIVLASSSSGLLGNFGQANYGAAKMGLVGLMHVAAIEGQRYGITANVIAPVARTRMTESLVGELGEVLDPELVAPMVTYLASPQCEVSHEIYSAGGGRFARFFVGVNRGWFAARGAVPSPSDVEAHLGEIRDLSQYEVLWAGPEENRLLREALEGPAPAATD